MKGPGKSSARDRHYVAAVLLALCIAVLGVGIHHKAARAIAPPIYDPMAYYTKGAMVWKAWNAGQIVNPLNVGPTVRPPGTMLLTSPLGFSPDFRRFFFRAIYVPIVLFVLSFWLVAESKAWPTHHWANLAAALMLASLPMFYQFERNPAFASPYDWGYVDCFVAAVAALATSLLILSARQLSIPLMVVGSLVGAFTLLVKPVGLLLIPFFGLFWATELVIFHWRSLRTSLMSNRTIHYLAWSVTVFALIYGGAVAACFTSGYLSRENLSIGYNGQKILIGLSTNVPLWQMVTSQIHNSVGWYWFWLLLIVTAVKVGYVLIRILRRRAKLEDCRTLAAMAMLFAGVLWWIKLAGASQIRYSYPFILMFLVLTVPSTVDSIVSALPKRFLMMAGPLLSLPFIMIAVVLFVDPAPIRWQRLLGVNLSVGQFSREVEMGNLLVKNARNAHRNLTVYVLATDERPGVVESQGIYRSLLDSRSPTFQMRRPNDWIHPIVVRRRDIVQSDFLLFYPVLDENRRQSLLRMQSVGNPTAESDAFSAWLSTASAPEGVEVTSASTLRLLRVVDRVRLDGAFGRFVAAHRWRDLFYAENQDPVVLTPAALDSAVERAEPLHRDIHFGNQFTLRAALVTRKGDGASLELYWQSVAEQPLKYFIFVHLIDQSGKMLRQADYEQSPGARAAPRIAHAGEIWRDLIELSHDQLQDVTGVGVGIFEPPATFLMADKGDRDWENRRLVFPLPWHQSPGGTELQEKATGLKQTVSADGSAGYEGSFDYAGCDLISGWVWNLRKPSAPVTIQILDGDKAIQTMVAAKVRPDLRVAGKGDGAHAFDAPTPAGIMDGQQHQIAVRTQGLDFELPGSPRTVTCGAGPRSPPKPGR